MSREFESVKRRESTIYIIKICLAVILFSIPQALLGFLYFQRGGSLTIRHFLLTGGVGALCLFFLLTFINLIARRVKRKNPADFFTCEIEFDQLVNILEDIQRNYLSLIDIREPNKSAHSSEISKIQNDISKDLVAFMKSINEARKEGKSTKGLFGDGTIPNSQFIPTLLRKMGELGFQTINTVQQYYSEKDKLTESMKLMNLAIETTLPLIKRIILATEDYEAEIIRNIFVKFEEIWEYSKTLVGDSEQTLHFFSRGGEKNEHGLAYIAEKNNEVSEMFETLSHNIEELEKNAHAFLDSSIEGLSKIRETINGIEEMAEKIKIISINVRIEAARESGRHSGFQVLGQEITTFAEQSSKFSNSTITEVEQTIINIQPLRNQLLENLNQVREGIEIVAEGMAPYKGIIEQSYIQMDSVIKNLNEISVNILNKMKQTVGDMQYHDITNQEAVHIIEILEQMKSTCDDFAGKTISSEKLNDESIRNVQMDIFDKVKSLITTGRERDIINELLSELGIKEIEDDSVLTGSTNLDEKTILF